ncbi:MAG: quinone-dependent dihydroorotate dehydrogenase [Fimbriimonadaceae bacterium]|nr:quinone-dependent dihydroorotate dehydrogenase [Fimbriimonadaceae bacterium]
MDLWPLLRPLLFQLDAEEAHNMGMAAIQSGLAQVPRFTHPSLEQTLFGVRFANPLGLAAGFDKNAVAVDQWEDLGFGFIEVGTATFHPQPGNPKPRLFRIPEEQAIVNRFGFNNDGAARIADRLRIASPSIPVGVNLGKSKITPVEDAAKDYAGSYQLLHGLGDYFVVNVSSPNTPGLRGLQEKGPLIEILTGMKQIDDKRPTFVKVAPDLSPAELQDVVQVAHEMNLTGIIATNTTIRRDVLQRDPNQAGGLSGKPLKTLSDQMLAEIARSTDPNMVIIGVGGVFTGEDVVRKIELGAHLVQVYTGWIYGGPMMAPNSLAHLAAELAKRGMKSVEELRGQANR